GWGWRGGRTRAPWWSWSVWWWCAAESCWGWARWWRTGGGGRRDGPRGRGGRARGAGGGRRGGRGRRGALGADEDAPILPVRLGDGGVCERGLRGEVETGRTHRSDHGLARGACEARAGAPLTRVVVENT